MGASLQEKYMLLNTELSASPFSLVLTLAFYQNSPPMLNDSIYMYIYYSIYNRIYIDILYIDIYPTSDTECYYVYAYHSIKLTV